MASDWLKLFLVGGASWGHTHIDQIWKLYIRINMLNHTFPIWFYMYKVYTLIFVMVYRLNIRYWSKYGLKYSPSMNPLSAGSISNRGGELSGFILTSYFPYNLNVYKLISTNLFSKTDKYSFVYHKAYDKYTLPNEISIPLTQKWTRPQIHRWAEVATPKPQSATKSGRGSMRQVKRRTTRQGRLTPCLCRFSIYINS